MPALPRSRLFLLLLSLSSLFILSLTAVLHPSSPVSSPSAQSWLHGLRESSISSPSYAHHEESGGRSIRGGFGQKGGNASAFDWQGGEGRRKANATFVVLGESDELLLCLGERNALKLTETPL
jgi:hypothetical protein